MDDLRAAADDWIAGDPDPSTRAELQAIVERGDLAELEARMGAPLRFGTAGIRGEVGAGPARMNRATVIRATRGVADHLIAGGRSAGPVVVGFDGRTDSEAFAADTVGVLAAAGIAVRWFPVAVPTPLVAHAALQAGAEMAIVVTASHNPPRDNGYKVYDANGAQIIPPVDAEIATAIDASPAAIEVPRADGDLEDGFPGTESIGLEAEDAYRRDLFAFRGDRSPERPIRIAYTPLHGVAGPLTIRMLEAAGHGDVHVVVEQFEPDGTFPTVAFPNPEEPGALDLAERLGAEVGADVVLANDPDGDRLAVSIPIDGGWRRLSGNEIGVLLGDMVLSRTEGADRLVVNSIVSTPMLAAMAEGHGVRHASTLTGFKWICNAALDLEAEGARFVYGFEEALGYAVGGAVRDKDGISAAVWFADLVAEEAAAGRTALDRLADLYARDGLWVSVPRSVTRPGPEGRDEILDAMGRLASAQPETLGGLAVIGVADYREGADARPRWLPAAALLEFALEGGSRILVRPSGTEPKLKIYADMRGAAEGRVETAEAEARAIAAAAADDLLAVVGWTS